MNINNNSKLIVGLDVTASEAIKLCECLPTGVMVKVGLKLFNTSGPEIVKKIINSGRKVFLDLKYFDIPNQVGDVSEVACSMGVSMFNLHALGGPEMIRTSSNRILEWSAKNKSTAPKLLGVTILTSFDRNSLNSIGFTDNTIESAVKRLAGLALENGCDGLVCSGNDLDMLRREYGSDFIAVTPGIRRDIDSVNDQKRVMTPSMAIGSGATHIVVGRPIYKSDNPTLEASAILKEIYNAKKSS